MNKNTQYFRSVVRDSSSEILTIMEWELTPKGHIPSSIEHLLALHLINGMEITTKAVPTLVASSNEPAWSFWS
jgi:hypothetical protein